MLFEPGSILRGTMATTHIDRQFCRIAPQALHGMAIQANGETSVRLTLMHDPSLPPIGKSLKAWVESMPDGHLHLLSETEVFAEPVEVALPDGSIGLLQGSLNDFRPFAGTQTESPDMPIVITDFVNFSSKQDIASFYNEIEAEVGTTVQRKFVTRKSHIPDPQIVIPFVKTIAVAITGTVFGKKLIEKLGDKVSTTLSEDIDKFYRMVRSAAWAGFKSLNPKDKPVTYVLPAAGVPQITFIAKTSKPEQIIAATKLEVIGVALEGVADLHNRFNAVEIQYILNDNGQWQFNYLLTATGQVLGTKESFSRRAQVLNLLEDFYAQSSAESGSASVGISGGGIADIEFSENEEQIEEPSSTEVNVAPLNAQTQNSTATQIVQQQRYS